MKPSNLAIPTVIIFYQVGAFLAAKLLDLEPLGVSCAILAGGLGGGVLLLLHAAGIVTPTKRAKTPAPRVHRAP